MKLITALLAIMSVSLTAAETVTKRNLAYVEPANERQMLDVYAPKGTGHPVVVWIHGGGWQTGSKENLASKPAAFVDKGYVFVAINYRLLPKVTMKEIVEDVAKAVGWAHRHAKDFGGDSNKMFIMGHSAGAQLAALVCTDERWLKAEGVPLAAIKGCVPVDGDTYDIPEQIRSATERRRQQGQPEPKFGHREKFGGTEELFRHYSAVSHIASGKPIPPFLILYVAEHFNTAPQAVLLHEALKKAGVSSKLFGAEGTDHIKINDVIGEESSVTTAVFEFCEAQMK